MDPEAYERALEALHCADKTRVQYFDSRDHEPSNAFLDDKALNEKLPRLKSLVEDVAPTSISHGHTSKADSTSAFVAIFASGDSMHHYTDYLSVSKKTLRVLIDAGIWNRHFVANNTLTQAHFSFHVQYDDGFERPVAIYVYLRMPRNSQIISLAMRIRLSDLSCICLISSRVRRVLKDLKARCTRQSPLLRTYPLHILNFILERRKDDFEKWVSELWKHVGNLETETGMTPWLSESRRLRKGIEDKDFTDLLQMLHAVGVELRLAQTIMSFAETLGSSFKKLVQRVEDLRKDIGAEKLRPGYTGEIQDQMDYNTEILENMRMKITELLNRTDAQINVTYSLIAQQSSDQNIRLAQGSRDIARLTAEDSRTMKTITVLTLFFLPSTMLASLWSANLFALEPDKSWRVYLGTSFALTIAVFCIWYLYIWISTKTPIVKPTDSEKGKAS